ncbi:MAG: SPOR domain-containing protein [Rubricoccaceae bacterium]|nr:SPOR domain-containing protein [Rubricoccaceae bacterium]
MRRLLLLLVTVALGFCARAQEPPRPQTEEGPFVVYAGSFSAKAPAQQLASRIGAWVLRTDLYRNLTPGFFAVVFGPFETRGDAEAALYEIREIHEDVQVRSMGPSILPDALGDVNVLAAVLGDLTVVVDEGPRLPCAPLEPHVTLLVGFLSPVMGEENTPSAGFWVVRRTGEIIPIRGCSE